MVPVGGSSWWLQLAVPCGDKYQQEIPAQEVQLEQPQEHPTGEEWWILELGMAILKKGERTSKDS